MRIHLSYWGSHEKWCMEIGFYIFYICSLKHTFDIRVFIMHLKNLRKPAEIRRFLTNQFITVNPYVTGSSPVARATIYVAKSLISRRFFFHFSLYIFRKNTIKKHLNSARYNHKIIHLLYGIFSIAGQNRYTRIYKAFRMLLNC